MAISDALHHRKLAALAVLALFASGRQTTAQTLAEAPDNPGSYDKEWRSLSFPDSMTMFRRFRSPDQAGACKSEQAFDMKTRKGLVAFRFSNNALMKGRLGNDRIDVEFGEIGCRYRVVVTPVP